VKRHAFPCFVLLCCLTLAPAAFAQTNKSTASSPPKKDATPAVSSAPAPVSEELMRARMRPPMKGNAFVDYQQISSKVVKDEIVTTMKVKNTSNSPIIGFRIDQYFFRGKEEISSGTGKVRSPMAPGEIVQVEIRSPVKPGITANSMRFSHANGDVRPTASKNLAAGDDKKAPAKKK
jgi:hypothetical protein